MYSRHWAQDVALKRGVKGPHHPVFYSSNTAVIDTITAVYCLCLTRSQQEMACKMLFVWRGWGCLKLSSDEDRGWMEFWASAKLRKFLFNQVKESLRWHQGLVLSLRCQTSNVQSIHSCFPRNHLVSTHRPRNSSKTVYTSSVSSATDVHVEHFEGSGWTSRVEEVTQYLVTTSRATFLTRVEYSVLNSQIQHKYLFLFKQDA